MRDFAEIFDLGSNFFSSRGAALTKEDFKSDCMSLVTDFSAYESAKFTFIGMLGLKPGSD